MIITMCIVAHMHALMTSYHIMEFNFTVNKLVSNYNSTNHSHLYVKHWLIFRPPSKLYSIMMSYDVTVTIEL